MCPVCGGENLYQVAIDVHTRYREDDHGNHVTVARLAISVSPLAMDSPTFAGRRDDSVTSYRCEMCCDPEEGELYRLQTMQHKGRTIVEWLSPIAERAGDI